MAKVGETDVFQLKAQRLEDRLAAGQNGDVFKHGLAAVAVAGGLDGGATEGAAKLVDDEGRERFAFDVLGDDQERLARLGDLLEDRDEILDRRDLLLVDQDVSIFKDRFHGSGVRDEVRAEIAAVELHPLDPLDLGLQGLAFLDRDHAVLADLLGGLGDHLADFGVEVRRDGGNLLGFLLVRDLGAELVQLFDDVGDGLVHAALHQHRIDTGDDGAEAFVVDRLGHHGRGGRAVARDVGRLAGDFLDHLRAHVLIFVFQLDFLGDGHAVLGHRRRAERLLNDDVAAARAESHLDGAGKFRDTALHCLTGVLIERNHLGGHGLIAPESIGWDCVCVCLCNECQKRRGIAISLNDGEDVVFAHQQDLLIAGDLEFLARVGSEEDMVADLHLKLAALAVLGDPAVANGDDLAFLRLVLRRVGQDDAAGRRRLRFFPFNDNAITQRLQFHRTNLLANPYKRRPRPRNPRAQPPHVDTWGRERGTFTGTMKCKPRAQSEFDSQMKDCEAVASRRENHRSFSSSAGSVKSKNPTAIPAGSRDHLISNGAISLLPSLTVATKPDFFGSAYLAGIFTFAVV